MIISVDHGNKSIKTPNALFTSGLIVSEGLQGFKTDYICWNNKYYTLTEQRIAYLRDKTEDERFYVLTLFAIAKELERRKVPETLDPIDITLLVGLPWRLYHRCPEAAQRPSGSGGGRELREGCHYPLQRYRKQV